MLSGMGHGWSIWPNLIRFVSAVSYIYVIILIEYAVPYPFLTENPFEIRVGIYGGASILALLSFWLLNALHP